jgi:hypothetical protein
MRKNSKDWNKVLKNLDKEFPEPIMNEVFDSSYTVDTSTRTDIEMFEFDRDLDSMLNQVETNPDAIRFNARYKNVFKKIILEEESLSQVARDYNLSNSAIYVTLQRTLRKLRNK